MTRMDWQSFCNVTGDPIEIGGANDWIPDVILHAGDLSGRTVAIRVTEHGKPVETGSMTAYLDYNTGGTLGDRVRMTVNDAATATWYATLPRKALQHAGPILLGVEIRSGGAIVCSRNFRGIVERSVFDTTAPDAGDSLGLIEKAVTDGGSVISLDVDQSTGHLKATHLDGSVSDAGDVMLRDVTKVTIGKDAKNTYDGIAIGQDTASAGADGVAVGDRASATYRSTAIGTWATASGAINTSPMTGSDAIGWGAKATAYGAVALGAWSVADTPNTVSVGGNTQTYSVKTRRIVNVEDPTGEQDAATKAYVDSHAYVLPAATAGTLGGVKAGGNLTVADDGTLSVPTATGERYGVVKPGASLAISANNYLIVRPATSSIIGGVKVGAGLTATTDGTLSTTVSQSLNLTNSALAIGDGGTTATGGAAMAVGLGATASAGNAAAVGQAAAAKGDSSLAVGSSATASSSQGTSIGVRAIATGWSTAIGSDASASNAMAADAFGCKSSATAGHAVALGASSVADTEWSVSVGNSSNTRRIVNVTDPKNSQDAATKAYVDALEAKLTALEKRVAALEAAK